MSCLKNKRECSYEKSFDSDAQRKKFARLSDTSEAREARLNRQMKYPGVHYAQNSQERAEWLEASERQDCISREV